MNYTGYVGTQRWSSDLNMIYDGQAVTQADGTMKTTDVTVSYIDEKRAEYYDSESGCGEKTRTSDESVKD